VRSVTKLTTKDRESFVVTERGHDYIGLMRVVDLL
jgi:hypothetical protein